MDPVDISVPSPTTTRGDLIRRGASADERLGVGTNYKVLMSDGTDPGWATLSSLLSSLSDTQGAVIYRNATEWVALAPGTSGYVLTTGGAGANPSWAAASGGKPTGTNWGTNRETLSAGKALVDGDDTVQFLDCNGADRSVTLPTITADTPYFYIANVSLVGNNSVILKQANGTWLSSSGTISPTQAAWCVHDGAQWSVIVNTQILSSPGKAYQTFYFGGSPGTDFYRADESTVGSPVGTTTDYLYEYTVGVTGKVAHVVFQATNNGNESIDLLINGATAASFTVSSLTAYGSFYTKTFSPAVDITAGDEIALDVVSSSSDLGQSRAFVTVTTTAVGKGYVLHFNGGPNSGPGSVFIPNTSRPTLTSGLDDVKDSTTEHMPGSGTDCTFSWNTQSADGTTSMKIWKSGALADTLTLSGAKGTVATVGTVWSAGDQAAVEYDAGTGPGGFGNGFRLEIQDARGADRTSFVFIGDPSAANAYLNVFSPVAVVSSTTHAVSSGLVLPYRLEMIGWCFNSTSGTNAAASVRRNGAIDQTFTPGAAEGAGAATTTNYSKGDYMEMTASSASGPILRYNVLVRVLRDE